MQRCLIILDRKEVMGVLVNDCLGDVGLCPYGIYRHDRIGQIELVKQSRDCSYLVLLVLEGNLTDHDVVLADKSVEDVIPLAAF